MGGVYALNMATDATRVRTRKTLAKFYRDWPHEDDGWDNIDGEGNGPAAAAAAAVPDDDAKPSSKRHKPESK